MWCFCGISLTVKFGCVWRHSLPPLKWPELSVNSGGSRYTSLLPIVNDRFEMNTEINSLNIWKWKLWKLSIFAIRKTHLDLKLETLIAHSGTDTSDSDDKRWDGKSTKIKVHIMILCLGNSKLDAREILCKRYDTFSPNDSTWIASIENLSLWVIKKSVLQLPTLCCLYTNETNRT